MHALVRFAHICTEALHMFCFGPAIVAYWWVSDHSFTFAGVFSHL
jgi:hypothetical protein